MKLKSRLYLFLIYLFLYAPIVVLIVFSFNTSRSRAHFAGFTFNWYKELLRDKEILQSLFNSLIIALSTAIFSTFLGTLASVGIKNSKKLFKNVVTTVTNLPLVNPEIVTGVSLMTLFVFVFKTFGFLRPGMVTLILSHITFCLPYVIFSVLPKLHSLNPHLYEAAKDLGCPPVKAFLKAVLPGITPGIINGFIMAFTLSLDDFVVSYFVSGNTKTLPITIYSMTRKIINPKINALSTLLFATVLLLLVIVNSRQKNTKNVISNM